jgi:manganese-dependent inorganic pyrophosphatase
MTEEHMFYICGHKNPDTDSIVSAIVMEDYFKKLGKKAKAVRVGKINRETEFVLKQTKTNPPVLIKKLSGKEVFLVDHNDLEQAGEGTARAEIAGVLDHHCLSGDIKTSLPIYFRVEPVGCTSTLIFKLFQEKEILLNKKQAMYFYFNFQTFSGKRNFVK